MQERDDSSNSRKFYSKESKIHVQSSPPLQLYEVYSDGIAELWTGTSYNIFQPDSSAVLLH